MRIVWLRRALFDIAAVEDYIEADNPTAARRVEDDIRRAVALLADNPRIGRPGRIDETRELVVSGTPYIVAYEILDAHVRILAVIHGARKWPETFS